MKAKLIIVLVLAILIFPATVSAESATGTSTLKQQVTDIKQERKNAISQIREKTKEEIQALRNQFKERLQTIKDARKKALTEKLDADIAKANLKHTTRFNQVLTKLQGILDKIIPDAKDPKTLSEIKATQAIIDAAKAAVANQAAKEYTIEITDEASLRKNVGATISQFRQDLMQVHKLVVDARQAIQVLRADKALMKKEASSSANL